MEVVFAFPEGGSKPFVSEGRVSDRQIRHVLKGFLKRIHLFRLICPLTDYKKKKQVFLIFFFFFGRSWLWRWFVRGDLTRSLGRARWRRRSA